MPQFPVNESFVAPITVISNTKIYWEFNNPIVGKLVGAHDVTSSTIRIGTGTKRYNELESITYIGSSGTVPMMRPASDTESGIVSNLATEINIRDATGTGAVTAERLDVLYNKVDQMIQISKLELGDIGERALKPWTTPKAGWRVLNGQFITTTDVAYAVVKKYLELNPTEIISEANYSVLSAAAGGVGGVHKYSLYADGRIRLPDVRGDFQRASDGISTLTLSHYTFTNGTTGSSETVDVVTLLPVVYVGVGQLFISENGKIFLESTRSKHIGEIFLYDSNVPAPGSLHLNGELKPRATYQALYNKALASGDMVTEAQWQSLKTANAGAVDVYSSGNGTTTFRLPTYNQATKTWPTNSIWCVQAFHAINEEPASSLQTVLNDMLTDTTNTIDAVQAQIDSQITTKINTLQDQIDDQITTAIDALEARLNVRWYVLAAAAPTSAEDKRKLWIKSSDATVHYHNGTTWIPAGVYYE